ncbi:MAG: FumA C-terminus/TtdB family hydratase beta subunit [Candidatus Nezhaarchaeota archaeon]|nr:FumA C-terminus/TtdB family hydratase beta subunit [Candidatus Nezhaarchaeota archaeon]MCX8141603.1 FumA C-terminus/TtdB family hydratase beta subunit [Candidatus Nezhaarchaeota archaeon]MDW8049870.1 FumA C-terminus/TtdB family hydratase beta subunit [Nitrososphaerota archaeon]
MPVYYLKTPISEEEVRKLKVNDTIYLTGDIVTARDQAHVRMLKYFKEGKALPISLEGLAIYHCGPVIKKEGDKWIVVAAGPTTSTRMEQFEDEVIKNFKVRIVIGKGGMGKKTTEAMAKYGAVYAAFTGGAAVLAARAIKNVKAVEWLDLGVPEALWVLEVENFGPLTIAIDSHGNNLYMDTSKVVEDNKRKIFEELGIPT